MPELDVQQAIEAFRAESQTERLALQEYLQAGFDKLSAKFDEHAEQDRQMFASMGSRVQDLEGFRTWAIRVGAGLAGTVSTGLLSWAIQRWG